MSRRVLHPLAEARRMRARGGVGKRYIEAPYKSAGTMALLWDLAPAGRRVLRFYLPSGTPVWVDDIALRRHIRSLG